MAAATPKELKIPKYSKDMSHEDCEVKLKSAASTNGQMLEVLNGDFMTLMPQWSTDATGERVRGQLSDAQKEMEAENKRAHAKLVLAMPTGKLTKIVGKATVRHFQMGVHMLL